MNGFKTLISAAAAAAFIGAVGMVSAQSTPPQDATNTTPPTTATTPMPSDTTATPPAASSTTTPSTTDTMAREPAAQADRN